MRPLLYSTIGYGRLRGCLKGSKTEVTLKVESLVDRDAGNRDVLLRPTPPCILYHHHISDAKDTPSPSSRRPLVCGRCGYSERAAEDERGALQLIEILETLSRDMVRRYDGRVVKFMGDAVLAEFPSTELAVRSAAVLSEQYAEQSAGTGRAHNLRLGVHVADVAVGPEGDLYGDGVNAAARVQEAAEPGQVVLSEDVWRQLRGRGEFQFESLGQRSLKGVGPIGLYSCYSKETGDQRSVFERWVRSH